MTPQDGMDRAEEQAERIDPRVLAIEGHVKAVLEGRTNTIKCPYCGVLNSPERDQLCCADFGLVVRAVLRKRAQMALLENVDRVMNNVADIAARN